MSMPSLRAPNISNRTQLWQTLCLPVWRDVYKAAFLQRYGLAIDRISTQLALVRALRGPTPTLGCLEGISRNFRRICN
jgi:hypothetical protein